MTLFQAVETLSAGVFRETGASALLSVAGVSASELSELLGLFVSGVSAAEVLLFLSLAPVFPLELLLLPVFSLLPPEVPEQCEHEQGRYAANDENEQPNAYVRLSLI